MILQIVRKTIPVPPVPLHEKQVALAVDCETSWHSSFINALNVDRIRYVERLHHQALALDSHHLAQVLGDLLGIVYVLVLREAKLAVHGEKAAYLARRRCANVLSMSGSPLSSNKSNAEMSSARTFLRLRVMSVAKGRIVLLARSIMNDSTPGFLNSRSLRNLVVLVLGDALGWFGQHHLDRDAGVSRQRGSPD